MENKFCCNCGTKIEPGDVFCMECGERLEEIKEEIKEQPIEQVEDVEDSVIINQDTEVKKSPVNVVIIAVIVVATLCGIAYGAVWTYREYFSRSTPPIDTENNIATTTKEPDDSISIELDDGEDSEEKEKVNEEEKKETTKDDTLKEESTKEESTKEESTKEETKEKEVKKASEKLDTEGIDGIIDIKYKLSDIVGVWDVNFKNYVSLEGEVIGLYESTSKVTISKVDDTNFKAEFKVSKASINGEAVEVGKQSFKGELNNDIVVIKMNCDKDYLYTGMKYNMEFTPKSSEGKLYGKCEKKLNQKLEGHKMSYWTYVNTLDTKS